MEGHHFPTVAVQPQWVRPVIEDIICSLALNPYNMYCRMVPYYITQLSNSILVLVLIM